MIKIISIISIILVCLVGEAFAASNVFKEVEIAMLKDNYSQGVKQCERIIANYQDKDTVSRAYYLLGVCLWKRGEFSKAKKKLEHIVKYYPDSKFSGEARALILDNYFSVQVGCFSKKNNAKKLCNKLIKKGHKAYILTVPQDDLYHVRVGKINNRSEVLALEKRLKSQGYPTKVCP